MARHGKASSRELWVSPKAGYRFLAALFPFIIIIMAGASCRAEGLSGYTAEVYHPKAFPGCAYAVYRDLEGCDESTILYYLHGSDGNVETWPQANRRVVEAWRAMGARAPLVVAVSFGADWRIFPEGVSPLYISADSFVRVIPTDEERMIARMVCGVLDLDSEKEN